ncbi:MAG: hypothetical protein HKP10_07445 [Kiritimatiellales bacterium]|nr:hypothetical protein [Kiritimatiellales bacterium]
MKDSTYKRSIPVAAVASVVLLILGLVELFVIMGGLTLRTATVRQVVPWAYEPYLKLVGEHPDSLSKWAVTEPQEKNVKSKPASSITSFAGFRPEQIPVTLENVEKRPAVVPQEKPSIAPAPTNKPSKPEQSDVPVG